MTLVVVLACTATQALAQQRGAADLAGQLSATAAGPKAAPLPQGTLVNHQLPLSGLGSVADDVLPNRRDQATGCSTVCDDQCCDTCVAGGGCGCGAACDCVGWGASPAGGTVYAEVQMMWLRAHGLENAVGKMTEYYDLAPRYIVGYENACGVGARARYWHFGEDYDLLNAAGEVRFEFDVFDVEATKHVRFWQSDLTLAGGVRFADLELIDADGEGVDNGLLGLTVAADVRTSVSRSCRGDCAVVYGARWSILGGDWEGADNNDFVGGPVRDDNVVVQELYCGAEWAYYGDRCSLFTRLVFEMQNWHSDAISQELGVDTLGFVGPGVHLGANF